MSGSKTLVIGSTGHAHVVSVPWEEAAAINLVDFDVAVVDCSRLTESYLNTLRYGFFDPIRNMLARLMASGGKIIALGIAGESTSGRDYIRHHSYSWSPVGIGTISETGDTVTLAVGGNYRQLLSRLKRWSFWYHVGTDVSQELKRICGDVSEVSYTKQIESIAENRYGQLLAGELVVRVRSKDVRDHDEEKELGPIILLPPVEGLPARDAVNLVLEDLLGLPQETLPPEWAVTFDVPGVAKIEDNIKVKQTEIDALEASVVDLGEQKAALEEYKKLLYASGTELEEIFAQCLEELGATIKPARYSNEEFVLEYGGAVCLVECKGVGKSASLGHLRQLMDYTLKYEENEKIAGKGVLFANAWNEIPPDERDTSDKPVFPANVIARATPSGIALVSSVAFFRAFCRFLDGQCTADEILRKIIDTSGVVEFK